MNRVLVRRAEIADVPELANMRQALWPESTASEPHRSYVGCSRATFLRVCRGSFCWPNYTGPSSDSSKSTCRLQHISPRCVHRGMVCCACLQAQESRRGTCAPTEDCARKQGSTEMASDAWLPVFESQRAHMKRSGLKWWIAAYVIERIYNAALGLTRSWLTQARFRPICVSRHSLTKRNVRHRRESHYWAVKPRLLAAQEQGEESTWHCLQAPNSI